jgi:hypothetical protein
MNTETVTAITATDKPKEYKPKRNQSETKRNENETQKTPNTCICITPTQSPNGTSPLSIEPSQSISLALLAAFRVSLFGTKKNERVLVLVDDG